MPADEKERQDWLKACLEDDPSAKWLQDEIIVKDFTHEPWHEFYWQAWHALRYDRAHVGMSGIEMPILFTAIDSWARRYSVEGSMFDRLLRFVSAIDFSYLASLRAADKQSQPTKKPEGKS